MKSYFILTFGCAMNEYDSERIAAILKKRGMSQAEDIYSADIAILNTCSVREKPQNKVNSFIGQLRANRDAKGTPQKIGVMGCVAQQVGERFIKNNKSIDFVVGTDGIPRLDVIIDRVMAGEKLSYTDWNTDPFEIDSFEREHAASALVTIMKGCNNYCSYCIVPYVRGDEKSRQPHEVLQEVESLVKSGVKEITLLGQNVNSYGTNADFNMNFAQLLEKTAQIQGLRRLRFLTSHPKDFSRDMVQVVAENSNICPFMHLPMQAGSNRILKLMNRNYTRESYLEKIQMAKELIPDVEFSSDFIVGFPGETENDFMGTLDIIDTVKYENIYVFNYSVRPGTKAENMPDDVSYEEKVRRLQAVNALQEQIISDRYKNYLNKYMSVMVTSGTGAVKNGRTLHNRVVNFTTDKTVFAGDEINIKITDIKKNSLFGRY